MSEASPARSGREVCRDLIAALVRTDERLVCLDSDTGLFAGVDFGPGRDRYINLGIAEQNLMGVAAGLARAGRIPVVNTMATFATTRALESIKIDIAFGNLPVRIVATHGGLAAGHLGPTHHCLEDLAIMRALPNMTVAVPADAAQTAALFTQCLDLPGPSYLRVGRDGTPELPSESPPVRLGQAQSLATAPGAAVTIVACGPHPVQAALRAAAELGREGIAVTVLNLHTIKPLDTTALLAAARTSSLVVTIEEHWAHGGLGSAVAECLSESAPTTVVRVAVPDAFITTAGDHQYLLEKAGIGHERILDTVARWRECCLAREPYHGLDGDPLTVGR